MLNSEVLSSVNLLTVGNRVLNRIRPATGSGFSVPSKGACLSGLSSVSPDDKMIGTPPRPVRIKIQLIMIRRLSSIFIWILFSRISI